MPSHSSKADAWNRFADAGRALIVGAAVIAPLWRRDSRTSFNGLTAILAVSAASKAIKAVWHEPRPDGENDHSFPSQHAGDCFAAAIVLHRERQDGLGAVAVGLATAVSCARFFGGKHHLADIVAGASLGIIAAEVTSDSYP